MTNGEKFQQIFAVSQVDECDLNVYAWLPIHDAIEIPLEWWNANYSEIPTGSTAKNDLGVDCVSRQAVDSLVREYLRRTTDETIAFYEHFLDLPSVTPQEPKIVSIAEIKYDEDKLKELVNKAVLTVTSQEPIIDKIRAEIEDCLKALDNIEKSGINIYLPNEMTGRRLTYKQCLEFIDKYKVESGK